MPQNYRKKKQNKKKSVRSKNRNKETPRSDESGSENEILEELLTTEPKVFDIKVSEIMGRYIVAARNLKAGELIIAEDPLAVGPCSDSDPVCLGCYLPIEYPFLDSQYKCPKCKWPICDSNCRGNKSDLGHSEIECKLFEDKELSNFLYECKGKEIRLLYEAILPLRIMLIKLINEEKWNKVMEMESHNEIRRKITSLWERNQEVIVDRIKILWNITEYSEDDIHSVCGILEVNCFEIGQIGAKARAIYPSAFLLAHDCTPNTTHTDDLNHKMLIRVIQPLKKNDTITLSYAYTFQGTMKRREHLKEGKFFWCNCNRCKDPSELGTYTSAMRCPKCKTGIILPRNPLDQNCEWICKTCSYSVKAQLMYTLLEKIFKDLDSIDPHNVIGHEEFLMRYRNVLTSDHYLNISAKYSLCQLYGRSENYLIHKMSTDLLKRKENYCREVLRIVNLLEPGLSRLRGVIMYELHAPIMIQATRNFECNLISSTVLHKHLKEVVQLLTESETILSMEPEGTNEHTMALAARDALQRIGKV